MSSGSWRTPSTSCSRDYQDAFDAQRRFVANASHELRTPLAMMRTRSTSRSPSPRASHRRPKPSAQAFARISAALRSCWRAFWCSPARNTAHSPTARRLARWDLIDALATRSNQCAERQLMRRTALARIGVEGSEPLLTRMVENVIENSVRHNQPHGFIYVTCRTSGGAARLVVESGGRVLDERSVAQLAQPFRRLGAERTGSQNGQGLGLSIVAAVADAHGGALELHARPEGGLRVQITLPAATRAHHPGPHPRRQRPHEGPGRRGRARVREPDRGGPARPGHGRRHRLRRPRWCVEAQRPPLRRSRARPRPPGMHGDALCRTVTASHDPAMILMLTAAGSPAERVAGLALGADDYLPNRSTSLSSSSASERSHGVSPPPRTAPCQPRASSSTRSALPPPVTAGPSTCPPKSSPCSKRCSGPAPARSAQNACSSRPGTRTPTRSPTRYASRSADSDENSENRR